jgi:HEAT repeat protein
MDALTQTRHGVSADTQAAAVALLRDVIQQDADMDVRREAVERLAELQDPAARTALIELARTHAIEDIRTEAVEALGNAPHAADTAQVLKQIANDDRSLRVRVEALETLAGLADGAGITALKEIAREHQDADTRKEAIEALVESDHPRAREIFERALKPSDR